MEIVVNDTARRVPWSHRARGITASQIAAVVGQHPHTSKFRLYHEKLGTLGERAATSRMTAGLGLEPYVVNLLRKRRPELFFRNIGTLQNLDRPWQMATPDRLGFPERLPKPNGARRLSIYPTHDVQAKTDTTGEGWGDDGTVDIPRHVYYQVQWEMRTGGEPVALVPLLIGNDDFRCYTIPYDEDCALWLEDEATKFLRMIETKVPPPLDWMHATSSALRELYADIENVPATVPNDLRDYYFAAVKAYHAAKQAREQATNVLREAMGNARWAFDEEGRKVASRQRCEVREHVRRASVTDKIVPCDNHPDMEK